MEDVVVLKSKHIPIFWGGADCLLDYVLGLLNLVTSRMSVILGAKIIVYKMIAKRFHISMTTRVGVAITVRRSKVSRVLA